MEVYKLLFDYAKNQKWDNFINELKNIDDEHLDINIKDNDNNYLISYAIIYNKIDIVKLLIDKNAKIDILDKDGVSILYIPIKYNFNEILLLLLEANKKTIGISILDIKTQNDKIALHYAILMKNEYATDILLTYGSNPNIKDIMYGYNSLHLAVKSRNYNICKYVIKYINDINSRCNTGETALHIACNFQLYDIVDLLIKNKINVNIQDYNNEISALHYCIHLNNKQLINILTKEDININLQDSFGNTAMHYILSENNIDIFNIIIKKYYSSIDFNLINLEGETILHILLKQNIKNIEDYIDILLLYTDLTIQDSDCNTCLYYIVKLNIWEKYYDKLSKKKLDIFVKNKENIMVIDLIEKNKYNLFITLIEDSYINRLKRKYGIEWNELWENKCSKEECRKLIKNKIINLEEKIRNGKILECTDKSYPVKKTDNCIYAYDGITVETPTFTGTVLDILVGLIYLLEKHKKACSIITTKKSTNSEICNFHKDKGIIINSTTCDYIDFEIYWLYSSKLIISSSFNDIINKCILSGKYEFIIISLSIIGREANHSNYLIYDINKKEVERYDPHGKTTIGMNYNHILLDELLTNTFKNLDKNIVYYSPTSYLPKLGLQLLDGYEKYNLKIGDAAGWCGAWVIYWTDMRMTYSHIPRDKLAKILIDSIKKSNFSYKSTVRNYSQLITDIRDKILNKASLNINKWRNEEYTFNEYNLVISELKNRINNLIIK